jgi:hypothetical protein
VRENGICEGQRTAVFLTPKLNFFSYFTHEAWFHPSACISTQYDRCWTSIDPRHSFEEPLQDQIIGVWGAITTKLQGAYS